MPRGHPAFVSWIKEPRSKADTDNGAGATTKVRTSHGVKSENGRIPPVNDGNTWLSIVPMTTSHSMSAQ